MADPEFDACPECAGVLVGSTLAHEPRCTRDMRFAPVPLARVPLTKEHLQALSEEGLHLRRAFEVRTLGMTTVTARDIEGAAHDEGFRAGVQFERERLRELVQRAVSHSPDGHYVVHVEPLMELLAAVDE